MQRPEFDQLSLAFPGALCPVKKGEWQVALHTDPADRAAMSYFLVQERAKHDFRMVEVRLKPWTQCDWRE